MTVARHHARQIQFVDCWHESRCALATQDTFCTEGAAEVSNNDYNIVNFNRGYGNIIFKGVLFRKSYSKSQSFYCRFFVIQISFASEIDKPLTASFN